MPEQMMAIFAFGVVITGVVFLGVVRARELADRQARVEVAAKDTSDES